MNHNDNEFEEEEDDDDDDDEQKRGFTIRPAGDVCPKGHIDWETVRGPTGGLIRRCRRCGFVDDFKGKIVK